MKLIECSRIDCKFIKSRSHSEGEGTIYETKENIKEVEGELRVFWKQKEWQSSSSCFSSEI